MRWFISGQRRSSSATRNADPEPLLIKISPLTKEEDVKDKEEPEQKQQQNLHNGHVPEGKFKRCSFSRFAFFYLAKRPLKSGPLRRHK